VRQSGLSESWRAIKKEMFRRMISFLGSREEYMEVVFDVFLANILIKARRPEGLVKYPVLYLLNLVGRVSQRVVYGGWQRGT